MSDAPNRQIGGLAPRKAPADFSRLQRRNRPDPDSVAPAAADPRDAAPTAPPAPRTPVPPRAPAAAVSTNKRMTVYVREDVTYRAKAAFRATNALEGDSSWSHFIETAILRETERREQLHHNNEPYAPDSTPLSPGRPLL